MSRIEEKRGREASSILVVSESAVLRRRPRRIAGEQGNLVLGARARIANQAPDSARQQRIGLESAPRLQFIHAFQIAHIRGTRAFHVRPGRLDAKKWEENHLF